ncbi:hypothetical protein [Halobacillus campisalis]|uniref:Uncharacterized protein n=1 Tax=Halobacillus campisalis TaxID=435909 RepID=A0ABW2JYU8_9BACI|nr:hypothetical protein [Halobacillus campisalis]
MDYMKELEAFHDQVDMDKLSSSAGLLWFTLMQINSRRGWKKEFAVPGEVIRLKSRLPLSSYKRARKQLVEKGYIKYTPGDQSRPAVFEMVSRVG